MVLSYPLRLFLLLLRLLVICSVRICRKCPLPLRILLSRLALLLSICLSRLIRLSMILIRKVRMLLRLLVSALGIVSLNLLTAILMAGDSKDYFSEIEFQRCVPSCSRSDMDEAFMSQLNVARKLAGVPFVLLSAYRPSPWDVARGRSGTGYHTKRRAVDVRCLISSERYRIVRACIQVGLSIGVYPTFLHIDNRKNPILFWSH